MEMNSLEESAVTSLPGNESTSDAIVISNAFATNNQNMTSAKADPVLEEPLVNNSTSSKSHEEQQANIVKTKDKNGPVKTSNENVIVNFGSDDKFSESVNLSWENINVSINIEKGSCLNSCGRRMDGDESKLHILKDVSGQIQAGTFVALMGSSGAGKSTLMNVLSHRNISNVDVSGTVFINNNPVAFDINKISAYVQQEDLFIGTLTVREHLMFQALLRMGKQIPREERVDRVERIIVELGLGKCSDTIIGIPGRIRGISGGEKKRLSFASEILTEPSLLFVDEPTSGLDSFMAQTVVETLHKLARSGKTVLATIHQPSSEIYQMFDNIILLADGRQAYIGSKDNAVPYFQSIGYPCPTNFNPADYFIQILSFLPEKEEESRERIQFICASQAEIDKKERTRKSDERINSFEGSRVIYGPRYQAGWFTQLRVLLYRSLLSAKRDKMVSVIRMMQSLILGIVVGLIYLRLDYNQKNINNFSGLLFFLVTNLSFASLQGVIFVFPVEVPVFLREHKNGMYRTDTYFLAKTLAEVPVFSAAAILLLVIAYWMTGLRSTVDAFFIAIGICVLIINTAASYGYVISTLSSSIETATALGPLIMLPLLLFGGFFINNDTVPDYFIWLRYLSWFNYGFENLMINQWDGYNDCLPPYNSSLLNSCINGDVILERAQLRPDNFHRNLYCTIALMVAFRIISFLLLLRRASKTK